jgi:hypothetical protein
MKPPIYVNWLEEEQCSFQDGTSVACWHLVWQYSEDALDEWAQHIRRHYIWDGELTKRCNERQEPSDTYLPRVVVPSKLRIRTGDFTEILISDVLEYFCSYAVPRYKQHGRKDKNTSEHGSDVIAYRIKNFGKASNDDKLLVFEAKSDASGTQKSSFLRRITDAATDSAKDPNRVPMTLDYMIDEAIATGDTQKKEDLLRFTNKGGMTFRVTYGSAVATSYATPNVALSVKTPNDVQLGEDNPLIVVHAQKFMDLINALYDRIKK